MAPTTRTIAAKRTAIDRGLLMREASSVPARFGPSGRGRSPAGRPAIPPAGSHRTQEFVQEARDISALAVERVRAAGLQEGAPEADDARMQIGRASCRERV